VGDALRQRKETQAREQATNDFYRAKIGGDASQITTATNALATFDPKAVYEMRAGEQKTNTIQRAAQGDKVAKLEMWGIDPDLAMKLDKFQVDKAAEGIDFIADAAFQIVGLSPEQRPQAWEQYIQKGIEMGFDGLAQYRGQYSDQNLNSIVAKAGQMQELQTFQQPKYQVLPADAMLVNTRDPAALAQVSGGNPTPNDLKAQAEAAIAAGADPEKVYARMKELGGQASPAPATFPGWY